MVLISVRIISLANSHSENLYEKIFQGQVVKITSEKEFEKLGVIFNPKTLSENNSVFLPKLLKEIFTPHSLVRE